MLKLRLVPTYPVDAYLGNDGVAILNRLAFVGLAPADCALAIECRPARLIVSQVTT